MTDLEKVDRRGEVDLEIDRGKGLLEEAKLVTQ